MSLLQRRNVEKGISYKMIVSAALAVIFIAGVVSLSVFALNYDKIYPNISICNIKVGGLSKDDAIMKITENMQNIFTDKTINIVYGNEKMPIELTNRISIDINATVDSALNFGKSKNLLNKVSNILTPKNLPIVFTKDDAALIKFIEDFAQKVEKENKIFMIDNEKQTVKIDLTKKCVLLDTKKTFEKLSDNIKFNIFSDITAVVKTSVTKDDVDLIYSRIKKDPVDATYDIVDNNPIITQHQLGLDIDKSSLMQYIDSGDKVFELHLITTMPKVTSDNFQTKLFADVLGQHTSAYNAGKKPRTHNLTLASNSINNTIIAPGKTFSFNNIVGRRTYERGFQDATVFVAGEAVEGIGGGICQVSSTLYSAQIYADLQTVSRSNHQFTVSYMPNGQDATVVYGAIDYVFKNNTDYPIKIVSQAGGGYITVKILGTQTDKSKKITIVNQTIDTKKFQEIKEISQSLEIGKTNVKQGGQNGATIDTYKVYWRNGQEEKRVFLHRSVYIPMNRIVQIGGIPKADETIAIIEEPSVPPEPTSTPVQTPQPSAMPSQSPMPSLKPAASPTPSAGNENSGQEIETSETGI